MRKYRYPIRLGIGGRAVILSVFKHHLSAWGDWLGHKAHAHEFTALTVSNSKSLRFINGGGCKILLIISSGNRTVSGVIDKPIITSVSEGVNLKIGSINSILNVIKREGIIAILVFPAKAPDA